MKTFVIKRYQVASAKLAMGSPGIRLAFLSDLHSVVYGSQNRTLLKSIAAARPDCILVGGDMMVGRSPESLAVPQQLLSQLAKRFRIFYSYGNHESSMQLAYSPYRSAFDEYKEQLQHRGVVFVDNTRAGFEIRGTQLGIYGLHLEKDYFARYRPKQLSDSELDRRFHTQTVQEEYAVLLAHNPMHAEAYFAWKSDLILAGHNHGGIVRFTENKGLFIPHIPPIPKYCCGRFDRGDKTMIVSAGLGEHTIPVRIHNPRELILIDIEAK
ncbi:MAG: metallophosphoesterase [Lachnospiraceae bacterium]